MHGNELNGVPCIHKIINTINVRKLKGTVVGVPCVNIAGYLRMQRGWSDGVDLNRHFPGKERGLVRDYNTHIHACTRTHTPELHSPLPLLDALVVGGVL